MSDNINTDATQRDAKGRFGKGNRGGPGNPYARQTAKLRQAMLDAVTPEDMQEVIAALKAKAKSGDVAAIRLMLQYTIGKPVEPIDPDLLDRHELETIIKDNEALPERIGQVVCGMPAALVL